MLHSNGLYFFFFLLFIYLLPNRGSSQVIGPPSLTAGAGSVILEKGALDTELIGAIIASKQDEIKKELAKRLILEKLEEGPYVNFQFAERMINLLFNEREPRIIKKEILQYGAEYMIVLGILEFYAANHFNTTSSQTGTKFYVKEINQLLANFDPRYFDKDPFFFKNGESKMKSVGEYFEKPTHIYNFRNYQLIDSSEVYNLSEVLIDMTFEVCRSSKFLQLSGLFQKEIKEAENMAFNRYLILKKKLTNNDIDSQAFYQSQPDTLILQEDTLIRYSPPVRTVRKITDNTTNTALLLKLEKLRTQMSQDLNLLFQYTYALSKLNEIRSENPLDVLEALDLSETYKSSVKKIKPENIALFSWRIVIKNLNPSYINDSDQELRRLASLLNTHLKEVDVGDKAELIEDRYKELLLKLHPITELSDGRNDVLDDKLFYTLSEVLLPELFSVNVISGNAFKEVLNDVDSLANTMRGKLQLQLFEAKMMETSILYDLPKIQATFIKLFNILNNLDKVESYDYVFKFLVDVGKLYGNESAQKVFNSIANATDKYLVINKEENKLDIDVESMLVHLFEEYGEASKSDFSMYFTVGYNYTQPLSSIQVGDSGSLEGLTYVSEKIGMKVSLVNWARNRSYLNFSGAMTKEKRRRMARKPIVTDWHAIAFASGLLYSIDALNSENGFNSPLVGFGTGLSFYNGLDLNFNYAFSTKGGGSILNASFDIRITEYLSELGKKNKAKQD